MPDTTARFALPLIASGQAQKEVFHNEALARIDALLEPVVEAVGIDDPPVSPIPGQCWIVGPAPSGAWGFAGAEAGAGAGAGAGLSGAIAAWTDGGWRFVAPATATTVWSRADGLFARFDGSDWIIGELPAARIVIGGVQVVGMQQSAISPAAGGTVIDAEARQGLAAVIAVLKSHGLTA